MAKQDIYIQENMDRGRQEPQRQNPESSREGRGRERTGLTEVKNAHASGDGSIEKDDERSEWGVVDGE